MKKSIRAGNIITLLLIFCMIIYPVSSSAEEINLTSDGSAVPPESDLCGSWTGIYIDSDDSGYVTRDIFLNIYSCDTENGMFEGTAELDKGENGVYFFTGTMNLETRELSFSGENWIENPNDFPLNTFEGIVSQNYDSIVGTVGDGENRIFSLSKSSGDFVSLEMNPVSIPLDWTGEYDDNDGTAVVRYNFEMHIQNMNDDGNISGTAIISPSDKADLSDGENGSCQFSGTIDYRYGGIHIQGNEWTDYADHNFSSWPFASLTGTIDLDSGTIEGISYDSDNDSEIGIWSMTMMDYLSFDFDSGFSPGNDSNNFVNTNDDSVPDAGFVGVTDYYLDAEYFDKLTQNATVGEKSKVKKSMNNAWSGSSYGIAVTMALLYEHYIDMEDLSSESASGYSSMEYPYLDNTLLNNITYYQLSQSIGHYRKESAAVSRAYNYNFFSGLTNLDSSYDSLSVFLQQLVSYASDGHVELLGYSTENGNHAVLVIGVTYEEDKYKLEICDVSSNSSEPFMMEIEKDFSNFTFTDSYGETVSGDSYISIYFIDEEHMAALVSAEPELPEADPYSYIEFSLDSAFTLVNAFGDELYYDGEMISGDMHVYDIAAFDEDGDSRIILAVDNVESYELSAEDSPVDIEICNADNYLALSGSGLTSVSFSYSRGFQLQGEDYNFKTFMTMDEMVNENEKKLVSVSASSDGQTEIKPDGEDISVTSEGSVSDLEIINYIGAEKNIETTGETEDENEPSGNESGPVTGEDNSIEAEGENTNEEESGKTENSDITDDELLDLILEQLEALQSEVNELIERNET